MVSPSSRCSNTIHRDRPAVERRPAYFSAFGLDIPTAVTGSYSGSVQGVFLCSLPASAWGDDALQTAPERVVPATGPELARVGRKVDAQRSRGILGNFYQAREAYPLTLVSTPTLAPSIGMWTGHLLEGGLRPTSTSPSTVRVKKKEVLIH